MPITLASSPDDVTIQVGGNRLEGWQAVSITRSCELMPSWWSLIASAEFLQGDADDGDKRDGCMPSGLMRSKFTGFGWRGPRTSVTMPLPPRFFAAITLPGSLERGIAAWLPEPIRR